MKIRVVGQLWYRQHFRGDSPLPLYESRDSEFWRSKNFITIRNSFEPDPDCAVPLTGENILKLQFDDITDNTPEPDTACIQFNEEIAQQIVHFVNRIDRNRELFINCAAGISRSGAVGEVLNDYFNSFLEDNEPDRRYFIRSNPQINGNPLVRRLLRQALFGGENPFSALSGLPPRK